MKPALRWLLVFIVLASAGCRNDANTARELNDRGIALKNKGEYAEALRQYDQAIALRPDVAGYYNNRGLVYDLEGDYPRAIQDFDSAVARNPSHDTAIRNRGRAYFYLGEFVKAAADLRQALGFDETRANARPDHLLDDPGAYTAIWWHIAMKRLGKDDAQEFAALAARVDSATWPGPIAGFLTGRLTADQLRAAAAAAHSAAHPDQGCAVEFYIGEVLLAAGDSAEAARRFDATLAGCRKDYTEFQGAAAELARVRR